LSNPVWKTNLDQQLSQLNRILDDLRHGVANYREAALNAGIEPPSRLMDSLIDLSHNMRQLEKQVQGFDLERRNLEALVDIGRVINSSLDLKTVLNQVMDTIIRLTGAQRAFLMMPDDEGEMDIVVARNWEQESLEPEEYTVSSTIVKRVLSEGEAVLTTNALADPRFGAQDSVIAYNLRSILCVPLKVKGKLTGVIYADNRIREGLFTERERSLLSAFANQAAVALENAMLFASVQRTLDEVTELKTLMEDVFASIASGVITTDIGDVITLCNQSAEAILGIPSDCLLGASIQEMLSSISASLPEKVAEAKLQDQRFIGLEVQTDSLSRGMADLSLNITPLKSADKKTRGVAIVLDDLTEKRRLEAQRRLFERMVSPAVIDQLNPERLQLGGSRMDITTIFADIRGFTSFSEATDPETLVNVLNRYLAIAADSILNEEGTIDKFLGDAVMAWFNAPIPQDDHALRAIRVSLAIQNHVIQLHSEMPAQFQLSFGIGIHSGEALLGLIGTDKRLEYTAIGDSVNTAKRLQENAQPGQILISQCVADAVASEVMLRSMPPIRAEGKERPLQVYEVLGML
jgi:adenylate cyclase